MPRTIDRQGVLLLTERGAPIVDVLSPDEHEEMRIAGSIGIWLRDLDFESVEGFVETDPIVVYCHDHL